jgi:hypothetical protein
MSGGLWFSSDTAIAWACRELIRGREICHPDEIGEAGGWRLGAIVYVLRHRYRWPIITERRGPARIAFYRLGRADEPLELPKSARPAAANDEPSNAAKEGHDDDTDEGRRHAE